MQVQKYSYNGPSQIGNDIREMAVKMAQKTGIRTTWTDIQNRMNEISLPIMQMELEDKFAPIVTKSHEDSVVLLFSKIVELGIQAYKKESA